MILPAAGVLVALLGGLGLYRLRGRLRKPAGETSFLESRLQPDSFFGASGGQRIDTREAGGNTSGNSSSMSFSLSQLDAIGDVDPVAEADVYLAYGRDLQAEEILKEAMRSNPERMAIRSKLLEVYAKRRDTKGFELLASQMFKVTRGEGEDWAKAQELGRSIDPDNELYQAGGRPEPARGARDSVMDPLGAPTLPHTASAPPSTFQPAVDATLDGVDLDLPLGETDEPMVPTESTEPVSTAAEYAADFGLPFDEPLEEPRPEPLEPPVTADEAPRPSIDEGLDFELEVVPPPMQPEPPRGVASSPAVVDLDMAETRVGHDQSMADSPLARKLELAEEFRQIGDLEGARDLVEEVLAKGEGALQSKARGMLEKLG